MELEAIACILNTATLNYFDITKGSSMNKLKSEINKAAHYLAQVQAERIKYALDAKCRAMLKEGKSKDDVARYLDQIATDGGNGLDALMGHVDSAPGRHQPGAFRPLRTGAL